MDNLWFWIGVSLVVIVCFQVARILSKNKKHQLKDNPTSYENRNNDYDNKRFSIIMNLLSFLAAIIPVFMAIYPHISITDEGKAKNTSRQSEPTTLYIETTEPSTYVESTTKESATYESTEKILSSAKVENTESVNARSVINESKSLKGDFSKAASKYKYILNTTRSGKYGFVCTIDNEDKSYKIVLCDENDNEKDSFTVFEDDVTYTPDLSKNSTYIIYIVADEGYPHYEIELKYPDSNAFN